MAWKDCPFYDVSDTYLCESLFNIFHIIVYIYISRSGLSVQIYYLPCHYYLPCLVYTLDMPLHYLLRVLDILLNGLYLYLWLYVDSCFTPCKYQSMCCWCCCHRRRCRCCWCCYYYYYYCIHVSNPNNLLPGFQFKFSSLVLMDQ